MFSYVLVVRSPFAWVNGVIPKASKEDFNDQEFKLLIVRHPFERLVKPWDFLQFILFYLPRLVSAFRDKLERCYSVNGGMCDLEKD